MLYIVFRLTRNTFWGHYVSILLTLTKPGSDRIRSTHETLYLPLSHLVEYRGLIRSGPIQVLFMPSLCHVLDETVYLLTCLINNFISNRQWPTIWKRSDIVPVLLRKNVRWTRLATDQYLFWLPCRNCMSWCFIKCTRPFTRGSHQIYLAIWRDIRVAQRF